MKRILLIDADIIAYQFASSAQKKFDFKDGEPPALVVEPIEDVTPLVDAKLAYFMERLGGDELVICLSCATADGWRIKLLPSYKAGRGEKPVLLGAIKDHMRANYPTFERPTLEADDVMGILSTSKTLMPGKKVIVSIDKDMKTIPGWLFNPDKDTKPWLVSEREADFWFLYQTLCGDTTDHYKGLPGCGDVGATKALTSLRIGAVSFADAWVMVTKMFAAKKLTQEDALLQARMARICRSTDYDYQRKEVKLWEPPSVCGPQSGSSTSSTSSPATSTSAT